MNRHLLLLLIFCMPFYSYAQDKHSLTLATGPALLNEHGGVSAQLEVGHRFQFNRRISMQHSLGVYSKIYSGRSTDKYFEHSNAYGFNYSVKGNLAISKSNDFWIEASAGLTAVRYTDFRSGGMFATDVLDENGNTQVLRGFRVEEEMLGEGYDLSPLLGMNFVFRTSEKTHLMITAEQTFPGFWNGFYISKLMFTFSRVL